MILVFTFIKVVDEYHLKSNSLRMIERSWNSMFSPIFLIFFITTLLMTLWRSEKSTSKTVAEIHSHSCSVVRNYLRSSHSISQDRHTQRISLSLLISSLTRSWMFLVESSRLMDAISTPRSFMQINLELTSLLDTITNNNTEI